jgi:hypothetical protein
VRFGVSRLRVGKSPARLRVDKPPAHPTHGPNTNHLLNKSPTPPQPLTPVEDEHNIGHANRRIECTVDCMTPTPPCLATPIQPLRHMHAHSRPVRPSLAPFVREERRCGS